MDKDIISREEIMMAKTLDGLSITDITPVSRAEVLLKELCEKVSMGGASKDGIKEIIRELVQAGEISAYDDTQIKSMIGALDNLTTTDKSNLVNAINEVLASGLASTTVDNDNCSITFNWTNGTTSTLTFPKPADGVSVTNAYIDDTKHLMMELSSGATIDAGVITGGDGGSYDDTAIKADIDSLEGKEIDTLTYANSELTLTAKDTTTKTVTIKPNLVDLGDVDITSPNGGDVVTYSASTGKFTTEQVSYTDQYVKMTATDSNAGYLADLIDDDTIKNNNGRLEVEKIKGQNITVDELNTLVGMNTNVKDSLNALASGGMVFKDVVPTYADLPNSAVNGFVYIVNADETDNGNRNAYIYSDDHAGFVLVGTSGLEVRNFTANPIDLTSEVINILPKDKMDTADLVDKTKDIINALSYPIPNEDLEKIPNLEVLKQINTEVINALNGKVNTTDIVDNLTSTDTDKPLSANQGKVLKGELNKKAEIDDTQASADKTYSSNKIEGKIPFKFGIDGEGNYGYFKADDSFVPFKKGEFIGGFMFANSITLPKKGIYLVTSTSYSSEGVNKSADYVTLKTVSNGVFEQIYHGESATGGYSMKVYKITTNSDNVICTYNSNTQLSVMKIS